MEWTLEHKARLTQLWSQRKANGKPLTSTEIGLQLGATGAAISHQVRKLKLEPRPHPVVGKRRGDILAGAVHEEKPPVTRLPRVPAPPDLPGQMFERLPCRWPIGQPRSPDFRFCDAPTVPGRSYCHEHCQKAYVVKPMKDYLRGECNL